MASHRGSVFEHLSLLLLFHVYLTLSPCLAQPKQSFEKHVPNFVVIISDDQVRGDLEQAMPFTLKHIVQEGMQFSDAFVTTPWCCPSRASILTGQYASKHKVLRNEVSLEGRTIAHDFQEQGYLTGIIGKYLNSWSGDRRSEFNFWRVFHFGNAITFNPKFNEDGTWIRKHGHVMKIVRDYTKEFLTSAEIKKQPFLLLLTPTAPHYPAIPEAELDTLGVTPTVKRPDNWGCEKRVGKPHWVRALPCPKQKTVRKQEEFQMRQLKVLRSLDELVKVVYSELLAQQLLDKTAIIFTSDNGLLRGSFGLYGKPHPYNDAVKVPFALRYPKHFPPLSTEERMVANIDIPATLYDLGGVKPSRTLDGLSLANLVKQGGLWREDLLLEGFGMSPKPLAPRTFASLVTEKYQLIVHARDIWELYDRQNDPLQLNNLASNFSYLAEAQKLFKRLTVLRKDILQEKWLNQKTLEELTNPSRATVQGISAIER
jgi:N-acetylglucosamine-6-sulfatase